MSNHAPMHMWVAWGTDSPFRQHLKSRDIPPVTGRHDTLAVARDVVSAHIIVGWHHWAPAAEFWPYSTEAAITPNKLYLIDKKVILVSPQPFFISQPISYFHRNRHFFATIERIIAPVSIICGMNCQGQTYKGKLAGVAMFLVRSGRSFRAVGPISSGKSRPSRSA